MISILCLMIGAIIGVIVMCLMVVSKESDRPYNKIRVMLDEGARMPTKAHRTDAGFDIYSPEEVTIKARESVFINTGVHIELPYGTAGMIKSRSGMNCKFGIQSEGVIDVGYGGAIGVKLYNHSDEDYTVNKGDKITQLVIMPILMLDLELTDEFKATERGNKGFGSSGR